MAFGIIIDWYGPYFDLEALRESAQGYAKGDKVLYMGVSKGNVVKYIGLSTSASSRFYNHHKLTENQGGFTKFFIGNIESQGISGRKVGKHPKDLKLAEHMLINVLYPDLNTQSKDNRPDGCGALYSRFFIDEGDGCVTHEENPLPKFPIFIGYNSFANHYEYSANASYA